MRMNKAEDTTPQQRRHARTKAKLRGALEALSARESSAPITAAAIAREAGVGRNVLYVGHTDILQEIRTAADARTAVRGKRDDAARADALKVRDLEGRLASMATENASLLLRVRETQSKLGRAEKLNAQLLRQLADARRPVRLRPGDPENPA
ncbi:hypothetical protein ACFFJ0_11300 [Sphingobium scionense]|uniref:Uncharacterized protein n=2 Tax=Sphingobium scionense TaxID=1404341 RepID=A0A7W6LX45_9SPHN|nr:hypothetical protein [Sphingobium scionense]MBB4152011.1 hypothetical protein [Sphingobium scionense]